MARGQTLIYAYFARLPVVCLFPVLLLLLFVPWQPISPLLYIVPFTVFFLIKEANLPKQVNNTVQSAAFIAFCVPIAKSMAIWLFIVHVVRCSQKE